MTALPHPEVLSPEYVPPTLFGRERELDRLRDLLWGAPSEGAHARAVLVRGPAGSGTSAVARVAACRLLEEVRRSGGIDPPLVVRLRVPAHRGTQGLAAELLRSLDEGFQPRGFHTMEMLAGFLRRLNRDGRSAIVVLDDVGPSAPDLTPFFRAFRQPDRFLPEGVDARIDTWFLLAGRSEAVGVWSQAHRSGVPEENRVELLPYRAEELEVIVRDRATRALGHAPLDSMARRVFVRAYSDGANAVRAIQLLRRELLGPEPRAPSTQVVGAGSRLLISIESHLLDALEAMLTDHPAALGELRSHEERLALRSGRRPLPATTLWRRLLRLESAGLVRRRVRTGGAGGTRSTLELLRPVSEWPVRPGRYDTPLGSFVAPSTLPGVGSELWTGPAPSGPRSPAPRSASERWGA